MCGIAGVINLIEAPPTDLDVLFRMLGAIRHRGPDEFGVYRDGSAGLASARLSIIDLKSGQQPIGNENGTLWIVFNGEVFNYVELRLDLEARGHRFSTNSDTEVILHLYEEYGAACLEYLNGQFAIAIWDALTHTLFLARDRMGIRPLFYALAAGRLIFGSEIKAIFAHPAVTAKIDPSALDQILTFWSTLSPDTVFEDVHEIPPGHYLLLQDGRWQIRPYWVLDFDEERSEAGTVSTEDYLEQFERLLSSAARIRLRADVPVGAYLSGGVDSSITAAIVQHHVGERMDTFSIAFDDPAFDESAYQQQMAATLGTNHQVIRCSYADIGRVFPDVVWHTETPILRTSPAPMFLLSELVRSSGFKVVLTGEGADEILAGYDIFKEMKIRRFWAREPDSEMRPLLLKRLYPDIKGLNRGSGAYLAAFFRQGLDNTSTPFYSHDIRWANTARIRRFLLSTEEAIRSQQNGYPRPPAPPPAFKHWSHLAQAQYLEITIFLSQYLLSSQGDRMAMAHSVEGRFPFLDHRLVEFCNHLPAQLKLHGLTEKWLLKQLGRNLLPPEIWQRRKKPYRAPIQHCFFGARAPEYVGDLLSEPAIRESALFDPEAVGRLARKAHRSPHLNEVDSMALVAILSTQWVYQHFVKQFCPPRLKAGDSINVLDATRSLASGSGIPRGEEMSGRIIDRSSLAGDRAQVTVGKKP